LLKEERGISAQGKQDLEIVLSETDRMAALLERLRTTYQPASRDEFQLIQMNDLIEDIFALLATHLRHNNISYAYLADPDLPAILGMENQLRQVFLNLVMNAVDAMAGGGHLTVATQFQSDSDEVLIKITDTGTGIDEDILPNIFEAFVTNKAEGTGLGLAISYEIILKHRGRITAENNPDGGATFNIWLPVSDKGER
ncbi:MAG TPA: ATP-binding protein, partial [Anaerolineales bacterium]